MMKSKPICLCFISAMVVLAAGSADALIMTLWDFGSETLYSEQPAIDRTATAASIVVQGGLKDNNGKSGVAYVDADGTPRLAGRAAAWDNVNSESELIITVNTSGWHDMILRWDYYSESTVGKEGPIRFDLDYRVGPEGAWKSLLNNQVLTRNSQWNSFSHNMVLLSEIENRPFVELRISDFPYDERGGTFKIDNLELTGALLPSTMTLLAPNGGENLMTGQIFDVRWYAGGSVSFVKLEYSLDAGAEWTEIATVNNTGVYGWQIPDANSLDCLVRASNAINPLVYDVSNAHFRIFRCLLQFDLNGDCYVDLRDLALLASEWLRCGDVLDPRCL
jgi:hypothetical protein